MYVFEVQKADGVSDEEFQSALYCARDSLESMIDILSIIAKISGNQIQVNISADSDLLGIPIPFKDLCKMAKGAFIDKNNELYPEFKRINPIDVGKNQNVN
jgi:hypothetical protein